MKTKSYIASRKCSVEELKELIEDIFRNSQNCNYKTVLDNSQSLEQLQLNVQDQMDVQQYLFQALKNRADKAKSYEELEKYIVYMNVLIDPRYPPLRRYKSNLIEFIFNCRDQYFTSDEYRVLRHLLTFKIDELPQLIAFGWCNLSTNSLLYKIFTCEIYLIEGQYELARKFIAEIGWIDLFCDYQQDYEKNMKIQKQKIQFSLNIYPKLVHQYS